MVELAGSYDTNAEPSGDFGPVPAGEYEAEIIESSVEEISKKENKGKCLVLVWKILNGDFQGRQLWQRLNLWPENFKSKDPAKKSDAQLLQDAINIANSEFASVREATGVMTPHDSAELHGRPCVLRVAFVPANPSQGWDAKNEVKHVKAIGNHQPAFSAPANRQAPPSSAPRSAPSPGASAPWRSKPAA